MTSTAALGPLLQDYATSTLPSRMQFGVYRHPGKGGRQQISDRLLPENLVSYATDRAQFACGFLPRPEPLAGPESRTDATSKAGPKAGACADDERNVNV